MKKIIIGALLFLSFATTLAAKTPISIYFNGQKIASPVEPQIINGTTMVPLRVVSEAFGASATWDAKQQRVNIAKPETVNEEGLTLSQLNKIGESVGMITAINSSGKAYQHGSGFIINGLLITNHHVVEGSSSLKVTFGINETVVPSSYVFDNAELDLAAIQFDGPSLNLSANKPQNKDKVYALGYPDKKFTMTEGIFVSHWNDFGWMHSARTAAGSSGGALINAKGEVIGVLKASNDAGSMNIAVRASILQQELDKVK